MAGSLTIYRIEFLNRQSDTVLIEITDRSLYSAGGEAATETYIDLVGYAPALELETFNVEENKFSPIIGHRATIRFKSTDAVNFATFSSGPDYSFWTRVTLNGTQIIFTGWLVMDDNSQAFLPTGQEVVLIATDNFGSLRDIELSDLDDLRPEGQYRLIEIIAWCLRKTEGPWVSEGSFTYSGIKVAMNLFEFNHHTTVNNCPLNQTFVDIRTFEKNPGELEDCHTVLTKILTSLMCRVCQYNNYWYILRIDEYKNSAFIIHNYSTDGAYTSRTTGVTLDKLLDSEDITFIDAQTLQRIQRPYKSTVITHDLELPSEIPANNAFLRGTERADADPTLTEFDISNWTQYKGPPNVANDGDAFIRVLYNSAGYETDRFVCFPVQVTNLQYYIESEPIYVCVGDKFSFSVDVRHDGQVETSAGSGNYNVAQIRLYADDSTYYTLDPQDESTSFSSWVASDSTWSTNNRYFKRFYDGTEDDTTWNSVGQTFEYLPEIPKAGYLTVCLHQTKKSDQFETHFSNLSFDYIPLVGGTYQELSGQQFKMSTSLKTSRKFEQQYYLFDAPCKSFKGALHYTDTVNYLLTSQWVDFAMEQYAIPDLLDFGYAFLHWQCNAVWNQNRLETWILNSYLYGLDVANDYASPIHKYSMPFQLEPLSRMSFLILSMRQNWHDCTWQATIAEINDSDDVRQGGEGNGENFEFKYLE
jgi:hypothetical protein